MQVLRSRRSGSGPRRWQTLIRIPPAASRRKLLPVPGKAREGFEYKWRSGGRTYRVRFYDPDPSVVPTATNPVPNASAGWVVRIARGKRYMDSQGTLHPASAVVPGSPLFDEFIANETHIPLVRPARFP